MNDGQMSLYDLGSSRSARNEAMNRVERNADEIFKEAALEAVSVAAERWPDGFIVDQVWECLPDDIEYPHEARVMGPVMTRAHKAGVILPTDRFRPSAKVSSHAVPRRVWVAAFASAPVPARVLANGDSNVGFGEVIDE